MLTEAGALNGVSIPRQANIYFVENPRRSVAVLRGVFDFRVIRCLQKPSTFAMNGDDKGASATNIDLAFWPLTKC